MMNAASSGRMPIYTSQQPQQLTQYVHYGQQSNQMPFVNRGHMAGPAMVVQTPESMMPYRISYSVGNGTMPVMASQYATSVYQVGQDGQFRGPMIVQRPQTNVGNTPVPGPSRVLSPGLAPQQHVVETQAPGGYTLPSWQQSFMQPPPSYTQQQVYASHTPTFPSNLLPRPPHPMSSQPPPSFAAGPPAMTYQQLPDNMRENTERRLSDYEQPPMMSSVRQLASSSFSQFPRMPRLQQAPDSQMPQQTSHVMMTPESPDQRMPRMPIAPQMLPPRPMLHQVMPNRMNVPINVSYNFDVGTVNRNPTPRFTQIVSSMRPPQPSGEYSSVGSTMGMQAHSGVPQYYPNPPVAQNNIPQQSHNAMRSSLVPQYVQQQPDALPVAYQPPQMVQGMGSSNYQTQLSSDKDMSQTVVQNYVSNGSQVVHQPQESSTYPQPAASKHVYFGNDKIFQPPLLQSSADVNGLAPMNQISEASQLTTSGGYSRNKVRKNAIQIINPDTGNEVKVLSDINVTIASNRMETNEIEAPSSKHNFSDVMDVHVDAVDVIESITDSDYVDAVLAESGQYIPPDPLAEDLELSSSLVVETVNDNGDAHESQVSDEFLSISEDANDECVNVERIESASSLPSDVENNASPQDQSIDNETVLTLPPTSSSEVSLPSAVTDSEKSPTDEIVNYATNDETVNEEDANAVQYLPPSPLEYLPAESFEEQQDVPERSDCIEIDVDTIEVTPDDDEFHDSLAEVKFKIGEFEDPIADDQEVTQSSESVELLLVADVTVPVSIGVSNSSTRRQYDRAFLLSLANAPDSVRKPADLPALPDVILDLPIVKTYQNVGPQTISHHKMSDFTPEFFRSPSYNRISTSGSSSNFLRHDQKRGSLPGGHDQTSTRVINFSVQQQEVKLHSAEKAWKPMSIMRPKEEVDPEVEQTNQLYRKFRSNLNKLTPENFDKIAEKVTTFCIDTEERLSGSIEIIFEKAISEPKFAVTYAKLGKSMISIQVPLADNPSQSTTFRKALLNCCQKEFQKERAAEDSISKQLGRIEGASSEEERAALIAEKDAAEFFARKRSVGNMTFIGELFKLKMLTEGIMFDCINTLLKKPQEDNLECLCKLLTSIGKDLDTEKNKDKFNIYFRVFTQLKDRKSMPSRIKFMIIDVCELRANHWTPRHAANDPRKIEDIHKDFVEEKQQKAALLSRLSTAPLQLDSKSQLAAGRGARGKQEMDEIRLTAVASKPIDPSKMKLSKPVDVENIQLGPAGGRMGQSRWQGGSTGGSASQPQQAREDHNGLTTSNRFNHLNAADSALSSKTSSGHGRNGRQQPMASVASKSTSSLHRINPSLPPRLQREASRKAGSVKTIGRESPRDSPRGSPRDSPKDSPRDSPRSESPSEVDYVEMSVPAKKQESMPDEVLLLKIRDILDEFIEIYDFQELVESVKPLPIEMVRFVALAIEHVLAKSSSGRIRIGELLASFVEHKLLSPEEFVFGLKFVLTNASDLIMDIPKLWFYLGEIVGPIVQIIGLSFLTQAVEPLHDSRTGSGDFVASILSYAAKNMGRDELRGLWIKSECQWSYFASSTEVPCLLSSHKLEFLLDAVD